jgi:HD domain-containing protein
MRPLSKGMRPLSNLARATATAALERAEADARSMPGNLLSHERLEELIGAARLIVAEVERLPEAPYDVAGSGDRPIDATVAGLLVGRRMGLRAEKLLELGLGLFLMDLGKLALPPAIVDKAGPLDHAEVELMRRHPQYGLDFLRYEQLGRDTLTLIEFHHERWDGTGYPYCLARREIPWGARVAALADAFAGARSAPAGVAALRAGAGRAFDPELIDVFEDVAMARSPGLDAAAA